MDTHFDRTFGRIDAWKSADAEYMARLYRETGSVGQAYVRFILDRLVPAGMGKAPWGMLESANRGHYAAHAMFTEAMRGMKNPRCWPEFIPFAEDFQRATSRIGMAGSPEDLSTTIQMYFQQGGFTLAGSKIYEVGQGLALELLDTELRGIQTDALRLPFETIYLQCPEHTGLKVFNVESDWHDLLGMYISEDFGPTWGNGDKSERYWRFMLCGVPKPFKNRDGMWQDNDALLHWTIALPEGATLDEAIERCEREMSGQNESEGFKGFIPRWREVFRFAMNAVLYATMPDADVEEQIRDPEARALFARKLKLPKGKRRGKLTDRLKPLDTSRGFVLGRSIKVDRTALEAAKDPTGVKRKLHVQFRRAGHFRDQPYGPGRKLIKRIRIAPTYVGNKLHPLTVSKHSLELPDDK